MIIGNTVSSAYVFTAHPRQTTPLSGNSAATGSAADPSSSVTGGVLDFTSMSPLQLQSTMNDLIKSGQLSFDDSSAMVGMIPTALSKVNYDGQAPAAYKQPMNILAALQSGIEGARSRGDSKNAESLTRALNALQALQGTPKSVSVYA